jgi:anthranilate synthase component 1
MWADSQMQPSLKLNNHALNLALQEDQPERFLRGVQQIREYIAAGDVFQVNLSRAWQGKLQSAHSVVDLYQRLRQANPAPFACLAQFPEFSIISSSPERLVRVKQNIIETRPIAGTRPRGQDVANDQALLQELISHPKERAEHIMLIDLERNDLGRVCDYGSVKVDELMVIESYQHVHHIVSNVRGHLKAGMTPGQVIRAVFPGGTITGCPKVRCMEIIAEFEQVRREAYTGSVGYINHNGDMDFNILIRTMSLQGQYLNFRTGAGIVIDSIAEHELRETRHKARGLLRALGYDAA